MPTLADVLRQTGYAQDGTLATPTPTESPMTKVLAEHIKSIPQKFNENQAYQMELLGKAFPGNTYESMMTQGDPKAMAELAMQVPLVGQTAFHGTKRDFANFDPKKSFGDLGVTWFSPEQTVAQKYAGKEGKVIPVEIGVKKTFDFTNPKDIEALKQKAAKIEIYDPVRGSMTLDQKIPDISEGGSYKSAEHPELFKLIKKMGYDAVSVTEDGVKNIGVFNPNKTVTRKDLIEQELSKLEDYRGSHTAPNAKEYGATLNALENIMPADVYGSKGIRLYGIGDPEIDRQWFAAAYKAKGNPDAMVDIYRAVPKGIKDINHGDWVTTSKKYAENHGENTLNGDYEILSKKVKASTLSSEGYPYEFGYHE